MKIVTHLKTICLQAINFHNIDILFHHNGHNNLLAACPSVLGKEGIVKRALCVEFILGHGVTNKTLG